MTAKEFLRNKKNEIGLRSQSSPLGSEGEEIEVMIEFAEHYVQLALKEASEVCKAHMDSDCFDGEGASINILNIKCKIK